MQAQSFTDIQAGLPGAGRSSVAWGDYDNDLDLDLLITGNQGSGPYLAVIMRNDAGTFTNIIAALTGIDNSSVAWGDYDNDGDLDILATGRSDGNTKTWLYRNDNGSFISVDAGFPNIGSYGAVAWGDIDGDGDLDAVLSGNYHTYLYLNQSGSFVDSGIPLPQVSNSFVNIGDFDNDGDQDLFVMGDVGGWPISAVCRNDGGSFTELDSTGILPVCSGSSAWADYDQDKDLDVIVSGFDQYLEPVTAIFRNEGNLNFTDIRADIQGSALGKVAWADYDNDGWTDVLVTGQNNSCGSLSSIIYHNDGNDLFTDINASLEETERGSGAWGDFDNDGDPDLVISGFNGLGKAVTALYRNEEGSNLFSQNISPGIPDQLSTEFSGHQVTFNWTRVSDNTTPAPGITYNLRVGTSPGGQEVLSSFTSPEGFRLVNEPGNLGSDTTWILNLPDGTYYWSVQANDHGFANSQFAAEQQFTILNVSTSEIESQHIKLFPNPFLEEITIQTSSINRIIICDSQGKPVYAGKSENELRIPTRDWARGMYFIWYYSEGKYYSEKVIKN
jgi:hypothetical protein